MAQAFYRTGCGRRASQPARHLAHLDAFSAIADLLVSHAPNNRPEASQASAGLSGEISGAPGQRTQFSSFVSLDKPGHSRRPLAVHAITGNVAGAGSPMPDTNVFAVGVSPIPEPPLRDMLLAGVVLGCALAARQALHTGVMCGRQAGLSAHAA